MNLIEKELLNRKKNRLKIITEVAWLVTCMPAIAFFITFFSLACYTLLRMGLWVTLIVSFSTVSTYVYGYYYLERKKEVEE